MAQGPPHPRCYQRLAREPATFHPPNLLPLSTRERKPFLLTPEYRGDARKATAWLFALASGEPRMALDFELELLVLPRRIVYDVNGH